MKLEFSTVVCELWTEGADMAGCAGLPRLPRETRHRLGRLCSEEGDGDSETKSGADSSRDRGHPELTLCLNFARTLVFRFHRRIAKREVAMRKLLGAAGLLVLQIGITYGKQDA